MPFKIPYPVPFRLLGDECKGWIDVTYLSPDGSLRLTRGNKVERRRPATGTAGRPPAALACVLGFTLRVVPLGAFLPCARDCADLLPPPASPSCPRPQGTLFVLQKEVSAKARLLEALGARRRDDDLIEALAAEVQVGVGGGGCLMGGSAHCHAQS